MLQFIFVLTAIGGFTDSYSHAISAENDRTSDHRVSQFVVSSPVVNLRLLSGIIDASLSISVSDPVKTELATRYGERIDALPKVDIPSLGRVASALDAWADYDRQSGEKLPGNSLTNYRARQKLHLSFVMYVLLLLEKDLPSFRDNPEKYWLLVPISTVYRGKEEERDKSDLSPWVPGKYRFTMLPFSLPTFGGAQRRDSNIHFLDQVIDHYYKDR